MKNIPLLLGTIVLSVLLIFGVSFLFAKKTQQSSAPVDRTLLETNLTLTQGATESAKVVVVEFSDFQCPACRAAAPVMAQLAQEFGSQTKFAFRYFPLEQIHANARSAAIAAQAAARQNAFWPYHDLLFSKQDEWSVITDKEALRKQFVSYAGSLKLNQDQFATDMANPQLEQLINSDQAMATQLKVNSTPTFFVNGVPTPVANLKSAIEQAAAAK